MADEERQVPDLTIRVTTGDDLVVKGVEEITFDNEFVTFSDESDDEIAMIPSNKIVWIIKKDASVTVKEIS